MKEICFRWTACRDGQNSVSNIYREVAVRATRSYCKPQGKQLLLFLWLQPYLLWVVSLHWGKTDEWDQRPHKVWNCNYTRIALFRYHFSCWHLPRKCFMALVPASSSRFLTQPALKINFFLKSWASACRWNTY